MCVWAGQEIWGGGGGGEGAPNMLNSFTHRRTFTHAPQFGDLSQALSA